MRIHYNLSGADRKALVSAISEELNLPTHYQGAPAFAYDVGGKKSTGLVHSKIPTTMGWSPIYLVCTISKLNGRNTTRCL